MFAAALIPTLEHGFSVAWFQIETKFYFGNHWMENRDFHVTIVQWKWLVFITFSFQGIYFSAISVSKEDVSSNNIRRITQKYSCSHRLADHHNSSIPYYFLKCPCHILINWWNRWFDENVNLTEFWLLLCWIWKDLQFVAISHWSRCGNIYYLLVERILDQWGVLKDFRHIRYILIWRSG